MMSESGLVLNSVDCGYAAVTPVLTRKLLVQSISYSAKLKLDTIFSITLILLFNNNLNTRMTSRYCTSKQQNIHALNFSNIYLLLLTFNNGLIKCKMSF
jgi:hypothetical protein